MKTQYLVSFFALVVLIAVAAAQVPSGSEFPINTTTPGNQGSPSVDSDNNGNFVVVWESDGQDGSGLGIFGRRFDSAGAPLGSEFQVNAFTSSRQSQPTIASDGAGNFVVVWESEGQDGSPSSIFGRRFSASGMPSSDEFQVNSFTSSRQSRPAVAADGAGSFVVVWESEGQDGSGMGVFGRRFSASGTPLNPEFQVNTFTPDGQQSPSVASSVSGAFVVVWTSQGQDGSGEGIVGRLFDASGAPLTPGFLVNTFTADGQKEPAVAATDAGDFVVVWQSAGQDGAGDAVVGRVFDASGTPMGVEFRINSFTANNQGSPVVSRARDGSFLVVWASDGQDGGGRGVFAQRFDPSGNPMGSELPVNMVTAGDQHNAGVTDSANQSFVVVWQSESQDGSGSGVFGRR